MIEYYIQENLAKKDKRDELTGRLYGFDTVKI
jgi:hypothetical protein